MTVKKLLSNALSMSLPNSQSLAPLLQAQNTSFGSIHIFYRLCDRPIQTSKKWIRSDKSDILNIGFISKSAKLLRTHNLLC